jgi:hypothetical protein
VAAARAALDPGFNLLGQAVTTQPAGQIVIVNGPVRDAVGLNSGIGVLGPGARANMTIGRALRLLVSLTRGGFPGRLDRATLGNPGKIGLCFAEDEESSPWEPLHVERGFDRQCSVVTVCGADAPLSISDHRSRSAAELARVMGHPGGHHAGRRRRRGRPLLGGVRTVPRDGCANRLQGGWIVSYVSPFDERRRMSEPLAPRRGDLDGRSVALLDISKRRGDEFLDRIEELLRGRGAETFRMNKQIFSKPASPEIIRRIADRGDLAVEGLAD